MGWPSACSPRSCRLADTTIVGALVPLLESDDPGLRKSIAGVLSEFEHETADRPPVFSIYRPFLAGPVQAGEDPPAGLVRYVYDRHAGTALLLFMRIHRPAPEESREILLAEHRVEDALWMWRHGFHAEGHVEPAARTALEQLALHPRWFARLYAAEIVRAHPAFGDEALVERLRKDAHPLVRERLIEPDPEAAGR